MPSISTVELANGERVGMSAVEIAAVPHVSTLQKRYSAAANIDTEYKQDMARLLSEVFQNYKNASSGCRDISLEMLWTTREVKNQPYKASITLYIILRAIGSDDTEIENTLTSLMRICKATLDFGKYDYRAADIGELTSRIRKVNSQAVKAVVKSERLEVLQNHLMPYCFAFDRIPVTENDLSRIVNLLIEYPDCAVSFQLMPVTYSAEEAAAVDRNAQMLDTLAKGVMEQGIGNISFASAEKHAETYKYYSRSKNTALFAFNALVYGTPSAADAVATRILAQLNNSSELRIVSLSAADVRKDDNFYPLPWAVHEIIFGTDRNPSVWNVGQNINAFYSLPYIITAEEASEFFRLPVGSDTVFAGLIVNESGKTSRTYTENVIGGGDITFGTLKSSSHDAAIGVSLKDLTKHMLIVGTPGSGKTTFSVSLLDRLWKDHHIPFLVIEPAKNEYRALVQSIPDLQVFTPGKNFISPFVFNPFVPPKNVKLETYKSTLKTAFAAAVSMSAPLDKIFEETVNNCYSDFRWLDTYTSNDKGSTFNITDFIKCFGETFESIGYTGDAKNIGRAGLVRLQSLVNLFDNYYSIPIEDLLTKPTIIELAAIENSDQKALIISLLLLSVLAYVNSNYLGEGSLRNVILLEEAHVLLDADAGKGEGEANPSAIAQGLVKRMLAEIRSYGVGVVIADQSPRKVTTDVVALTDIKLAFRLVEANDKQILADSSNMNETQTSRLAKLKPGEAFLFFGKLDEPEEIKTEDYRLANNISISLSDESIKTLSTYWDGRKDKLRPYPECAYCRCCAGGCDYNKRILGREIARRIFVKNFKPDSAAPKEVRDVFRQMTPLIKQELNDEVFEQHLFACTELHLLRRVRYGTKIKISDATVQVTLSKIGGDV
ncbi:MAG: ATP-binding protein [Planctomycetaceae bacterium]|jgi:DNA helicase HerA-like ATPase|nr:ATP-binding protein [Planctomycetaceae bacterium]